MNLPDINVWVALTLANHVHHPAATRWFTAQTEPTSITFCRVTQQGYLRLLSNERMMRAYGLSALTNTQAWNTYEKLRADFRITFSDEPDGVENTWREIGCRDTASTKLWIDAYLAAFALRAGFQIVTADKAFSQFKGLKTQILKSKTV